MPSRTSLITLVFCAVVGLFSPSKTIADGTVVAWGDNGYGQSSVPPNLGPVKALAAGGFHSLAVRANGTVVAWGRNTQGQATVPAGLTNVIAVSGGGGHSLALKSDGTVVGWGANDLGQSTVPPGLANVVAISSGWNVSMALRADGTIVGWGQNNYNQANPTSTVVSVRAIASTEAHSLALISNGTVIAWGTNAATPPLNNIIGIAANGYHDLALKNDGTVIAWRTDGLGQNPVPADLNGVAQVAAGYNHYLALKNNGTVVAWGSNTSGQTNVPPNLTNVIGIAGGYSHSLALVSTGDTTPPTVAAVTPAPSSTIRSLSQITINFSEVVTNVNATDLLINGQPASNIATNSSSTFTFGFAQPPPGVVNVEWAPGHGITDLATNAFSGGSWSYVLDTNVPLVTVIITEFMASNDGPLVDEDGDTSDWIEIYNPDIEPVVLEDWSLTDDPNNIGKWRFPAKTISPKSYLIVFASGKERYALNTPLHTNFKLNDDGGYLALARPNGVIVSEFAAYPPQRTGASYGVSRQTILSSILLKGAQARVLVPSNGALGLTWTDGAAFDDSVWLPRNTGIGYDQGVTNGIIPPLGYWAFDDNSNPSLARDSSGNSHHGTLVGNVAFTGSGGGRTGLAGDRAMNFGPCDNGAHVKIADAITGWFDPATLKNAVTFAFWIYGATNQPCINSAFHLTGAPDGGETRYVCNAHLPWENSIIYWDTGGVESNQRVSISQSDTNKWKGRWNHYAFIKNGNSKQIWQNGVKILDQSNSDPLKTARSFYIGSGPEGQWSYGGLIDDFGVWDEALSQAQIEALAAGGTSTFLDTYGSLLGGDISQEMTNKNASALVRIPFVLEMNDLESLVLNIRYDDGYVCYLNGTEVARRNTPSTVEWNSSATIKRTRTQARSVETVNLTAAIGTLHAGTNILAFQALNSSAGDTELLLLPELIAARTSGQLYFTTPTPGATNGIGIGGFVEDTKFSTDRGFYFSPTNIQITTTTPGAYIIYTRDGTMPTPSNGSIVNAVNPNVAPTATVAIATTTLLRAAAFKDGWRPTDVDTHTYLFPAAVATQVRPGWPGASQDDYAIDPRVVSTALPGYSLSNALLSIPTLSIMMPSNDLFSASSGIYPNSTSTGTAWEKAGSAELMYPDGRPGFQINCGVRIHGGVSRINSFTPKHSFSLLFRETFGASKLDFPLFTNSTVRKFDQLVLRGSSTDSMAVTDGVSLNGEPWPRWTRDEASQMRDQWMRDAQNDLGHASAHGIYVHLYLDGLYWGLYNLAERPDDSFAEEYYGGQKEEFDVISDVVDLHSGTWTAWNEMMSLASAGLGTADAMQRIQGNNPDGTRNPAYPVYFDLTNLVDYMILHIASGADDWPDHNWWAIRRRGSNSAGFRFLVWDQELTNNSLERTKNSHSPYPLFAEVSFGNSPAFLYSKLRANAEFRSIFADRIQKHMFNNGQLSVSNNIARWQKLHNEIDHAVVGESARWGDNRRPSQPYKREVEWVSNQTWMVTTYFPSNHTVALNRFRAANLYPSLGAPNFSQFGGNVPSGFALGISHTNTSGVIFYTLDGSDPRGAGGVIASGATFYSQPIALTSPTLVRARVNNGSAWSAIVEAQFFPPQDLSKLQPSEIMYNPTMFGTNDGDEVEFLELKNVGTNALDLSALTFSKGIQFTFSNETYIAPGQFFVLARNPGLFSARYSNAPLHGLYSGKLDNNGENLTLSTSAGATVFSVTYNNKEPWPLSADNTGLSLQRMNFVVSATNGRNWIAASPTPGADLAVEFQDRDGDGMPNGWETAHGLNPDVNDALLDNDGDGLTNFEEYLSNTNPSSNTDRLALQTINSQPGMVVMKFMAHSNRTYSVLWRNSVENGNWSNLVNIAAQSTSRVVSVTNTVPAGSASRFYRLLTPKAP
jgi:hypothetical protein